MIKRMKLYFQMKKLERQMKFELLSKVYQFVADKDDYIKMAQQLPAIVNKLSASDVDEIKTEIINKVVEFTYEKSQMTETE